jgi:hypothetical protein
MPSIYFDSLHLDDDARRQRIFNGSIFLTSPQAAVSALCGFAQSLIEEAFAGKDPGQAQFSLAVEDFVGIIGPLKTRFTNHERTKELVRDVLTAFGCDPAQTFFDVPRLRIVTHGGYLTAGVGYAYRPHRDTWYSSPTSQVNWWMPVYRLEEAQALVFYPGHWAGAVRNSSRDFDYDEWCRIGRQQAASQITVDTRKHPVAEQELSTDGELKVVCDAAGTLMFSAGQLHATAPNTSGRTRFSVDFRTIAFDDLRSGNGAHNQDSDATGTTLGDFLLASDLSPVPPELIRSHLRVKK